MKTILLNTAAAAALVLGVTAATAQTGGGAPMEQPGVSGGASGGAAGSGPGGASGLPNRAETGAGAAGGAAAECPPGAPNCAADAGGGAAAQGEKMKGEKSGSSAQGEKMKDEKSGTSAQGEKADTKAGTSAEGRKDGDMKSGRAAASANLTTEQRTTIKERLVTKDVDRVNIDFNVSVGVAVPATVRTHVHRVPVWLVELVPAYEGYSYIVLADGRIVIIEPASYEIVTIISV